MDEDGVQYTRKFPDLHLRIELEQSAHAVGSLASEGLKYLADLSLGGMVMTNSQRSTSRLIQVLVVILYHCQCSKASQVHIIQSMAFSLAIHRYNVYNNASTKPEGMTEHAVEVNFGDAFTGSGSIKDPFTLISRSWSTPVIGPTPWCSPLTAVE